MEISRNNSFKNSLQIGLVATVADAEGSIIQFIEYHLRIGFSKIYLFVDDNCINTIDLVKKYPQVQYFFRDAELESQWQQTPVYQNNEKRDLIDIEVMVRQEMNFFVAFKNAQLDKVDWLLHIDLDELFYPNGEDVVKHFSGLQKNGITCITYLNYEAILHEVETSTSIYAPAFFKRNFFRFKHWIFSRSQREFIKENSWIRTKYFNFYQNGKSAVNTFQNTPTVYDVHSIITKGMRKFGKDIDPLILHFSCTTKKHFIEKYRRLGNFPADWFGISRAGDCIETTHLEARDIFQSGDEQRLDIFYHENFVLNKDKVDALMENNMAVHIDFHLQVLSD